jgi:signal transduction histidine kinase/CheY-like chemotaxis protein/PAS domain-containing protein
MLDKEENNKFKISERRAAVVDALNKAIEIFSALKEETFDDVMTNGIRPIADAAGLDRVVLYTVVDRDGVKRLGQVYRWDKSEGGLMSLADELKVLPCIPVLENWISITSQGGSVRLRESDYSRDEAVFLRTYGVKSILIMPIFTHGEFWGVVNFQDHTNDRYFDEDCGDLLYSAARIFSSAIIMEDMTCGAIKTVEALKRREKMADTLNRAAVMFLSQSKETFEATMTAGVKEIADVFNLDRFSVWRNFIMPDNTHVSQIYRWDRGAGGTTVPTKELSDVTYAQLAPRWEKLFASGGTINSPVRLLPEAAMLQSFGVVSAFIMPLFISNIFWGFALLEDRHTERFFEEDSIDMMRSAAFLCANTVIHADMEREIANASEFNRAVLDALPHGFTVFDENSRVIDCNDFTLNALRTTKKYYIEHFYEFSPEYQSDGVKSIDKAAEVVKRALNGEKLVLEWENCTSMGEIIPHEVTLVRTMYNGKYVVMGYQYDLRNNKKMESNIREQGELLKVRLDQQELVSAISRGFISSGNSEAYVKEAIARLGHYQKVSSVFIFGIDFQNSRVYPAYHWSAVGAAPRMADIDLFNMTVSTFPERLPDRNTIAVSYCEDIAASPDKTFIPLLSVDVHAFICAPLYVDGLLWGLMRVEQHFMPRKWTDNEKRFVGIIASTIAGVIMRDIYTAKLKDALHNATVASQAKSEFLSNMSHEMRTPLNAITGMTAIGRSAKDMERKDYAFDKIEAASTHLLGVINDVLDMSKIEANMLELSPVEFSFEKMLQKVVTVINFRIDEKKQKFSINIDKEIPEVMIADDQRLAQVITNLLGNAVKFTPEEGSIHLDSRLLGEEKGVYTIQISVKDSGIGINAEQQAKLFQSFQQAESSTARKFGGTGLGLAISKSIVEMMGGKIWIQSEPGEGSTFTFTVQVKRGIQKYQGPLSSYVNWSNVRILAVDDDPDILVYFRDIINGFGILCDTAISGEEALELVKQKGGYHIYFVDWKMPGMDGVQLANELNKQKSENSVIIMISAVEWSAIAEDAQKAGMSKFLSKPLFPSSIAEIINECIGTGKKQEEEKEVDIKGIFRRYKILLVEDVEINREIVLTLLEPTEINIDCAENGIEAVRMYGESPDKYDFIFMDIQMPEMDGYEATRRIRTMESEIKGESVINSVINIEKNIGVGLYNVKTTRDNMNFTVNNTHNYNGGLRKRVPIIAMTANVFKEDIEKCLEAGMDSHVGKPLDFNEVMEKLKYYLLNDSFARKI